MIYLIPTEAQPIKNEIHKGIEISWLCG